jgi:UDP-N-acetylmuramate dehydrogenase
MGYIVEVNQSKIANLKSQILENEPLARYTSWRIGGPARYFANVTTAGDLGGLINWATAREVPVFILGGGTNILVADGGFPGLVIRNRAANWQIEQRGGEPVLWVESGAPTAGTVRRLAARGIGGLTWAEGLPGTLGGALYGNAGCYGGDMAHHLIRAWVLRNGEVEEWPADRFAYGYRTSVLKRGTRDAEGGTRDVRSGISDLRTPHPAPRTPPVILAAELRVTQDDPARLDAQMAEIAAARKGKTPAGSSCGSVFKNPPGTTAGTVLDQCGLKGNAVVSDKHANYIVNLGGATAADVLGLTEVMRERVLREMGIELDLEVQLVGAMSNER